VAVGDGCAVAAVGWAGHILAGGAAHRTTARSG
jgi:hypothetical protein